MSAQSGFGPETFQFLEDLKANNNKAWFDENRDRYDTEWMTPATAFVNAVADPLANMSPPHIAVAKVNKSIRRINRDVRFSADKSPYNPRLHLVFWIGDHPNRSPAIHLVIHSDHVGYGVGQWQFDPAKLEAYRKAVTNDKKRHALEDAIKMAGSVGCEFDTPELKTLPKGYSSGGESDELLKRKSVVLRTITTESSPAVFQGAKGIGRFLSIAEKLTPINAWLLAL